MGGLEFTPVAFMASPPLNTIPKCFYFNFTGFDWCVEVIKNSEYSRLVGELEINKAVMFLKQRQLSEAIDTLKAFDNETSIASSAAVNLSFIYYLVRLNQTLLALSVN